eukprot:NODE_2697_length_1116_cov_47.839232_g2574_i0.p1 GENE.NODE_2697_length_1116_cov_47.839232_g2574_i0~~NODE_2697_length_1116_cov_47.839232_g2574_i0.p1  ORF type:complete len:345 (-),score=46.47 NODE_2697_length_1116_cov_47.839232_g2574_i0:80-1033(-)
MNFFPQSQPQLVPSVLPAQPYASVARPCASMSRPVASVARPYPRFIPPPMPAPVATGSVHRHTHVEYIEKPVYIDKPVYIEVPVERIVEKIVHVTVPHEVQVPVEVKVPYPVEVRVPYPVEVPVQMPPQYIPSPPQIIEKPIQVMVEKPVMQIQYVEKPVLLPMPPSVRIQYVDRPVPTPAPAPAPAPVRREPVEGQCWRHHRMRLRTDMRMTANGWQCLDHTPCEKPVASNVVAARQTWNVSDAKVAEMLDMKDGVRDGKYDGAAISYPGMRVKGDWEARDVEAARRLDNMDGVGDAGFDGSRIQISSDRIVDGAL